MSHDPNENFRRILEENTDSYRRAAFYEDHQNTGIHYPRASTPRAPGIEASTLGKITGVSVLAAAAIAGILAAAWFGMNAL